MGGDPCEVYWCLPYKRESGTSIQLLQHMRTQRRFWDYGSPHYASNLMTDFSTSRTVSNICLLFTHQHIYGIFVPDIITHRDKWKTPLLRKGTLTQHQASQGQRSDLVSDAVINTIAKGNLVRKGFISSYMPWSQSIIEGRRGRSSRQEPRTEIMEERH